MESCVIHWVIFLCNDFRRRTLVYSNSLNTLQQCSYRVEEIFDAYKIGEYIGVYEFNEFTPEQMAENDNGFAGEYKVVEGVELPDIVAYPPYVTTAYFFLNILPIVIPTYLIVFFCESYRY